MSGTNPSQPAYRYSATVLRVVDGDTVDLRVDCGFRVWLEDRFRLYGINAPELNTMAGQAARQWLMAKLPVGASIIAETFKPKDKYGRWLGILYLDGLNLNQALVDAGQAVPYDA